MIEMPPMLRTIVAHDRQRPTGSEPACADLLAVPAETPHNRCNTQPSAPIVPQHQRHAPGSLRCPWRAHNRPPHPREIPIARGTPPHLRPRFRALALLERQALRRVARHQREGVREPAQGRTNALSWMVRRTKIQEAPDANKDMRAVVDAAEAAGLAKKVARLAPLICVKG